MRVLVLNASPKGEQSHTMAITRAFLSGFPEGTQTELLELRHLNIRPCTGCLGCWTKTPGRCVIRDDTVKVYPLIAQSDAVLYVSRIKYGGYDTVMKTMLERAIPVQQAFIRVVNGETHHVQRSVAPKDAVILAYGASGEEERALFRQLIARNAHNMNFRSHRVLFCKEDQVPDLVQKEVAKWGIS